MKVQILGMKSIQGKSKKTGKPFDGVIIGYGYDDRETHGQAVKEVFVGRELYNDALNAQPGLMPEKVPGLKADFDFNNEGFLVGFSILGK